MTKERQLARCKDFDFYIEDHGLPAIRGGFEYDNGGFQGFGYMVNTAFLMRFMAAVGVDSLRALNGKSCWVTADWEKIYKVEPLHKKDGVAFDIEEWVEWTKKNDRHGADELLGRKSNG